MQQRSAKPGSSRSPLVRGLSLMGSIGMLGGGMVWAQTQTPPEGAIAPSAPVPPAAMEISPTNQAPAAPESAPVVQEQSTAVAPVPVIEATEPIAAPEEVAPSPKKTAADIKPAPVWEAPQQLAPENVSAEEESEGWAPAAAAPATPELSNPNNQQIAPSLEAPQTASLSAKKAKESAALDYNNLYVDPTSYNIGATSGSEEPAAVAAEPASGCSTEGSACGVEERSPSPDTASENVEVGEPNVVAEIAEPPAQPPAVSQPEVQPLAQSQETLPYFPPQPVQPVAPAQPLEQPVASSPQVQPVAQAPAETRPYLPPQPVQPVAPSLEAVPYPPPQPVQAYAPPQQVYASAETQNVQPYPETEEVQEESSIAPVSVSSNTNRSVATLPPPGPAGFYYYNSMERPTGLPGNGNISLMFPLAIPSPITSAFGWRVHPISGISSFHSGTDLGAPMGTPVLAAYDGKVAIADYLGGYGLTVVLQHNNGTQETLYGHLSEILVKPGESVAQGFAIGRVGSTGNSTGPHLHFEHRQMTKDGWVTLDPGIQLESALAQLVKFMQTAQSSPKPKAG